MNIYSRRDIAVMAYLGGLLTGVIVAFASCSPPEQPCQVGVADVR